jgi:RNA polymerase sigma factor (sigma-70 family)
MNTHDNLKTSATFIGLLKDESDLGWAIFYERYSKLIVNFAIKRGCSRELAEDVLQETMMALLHFLPKFDYDRDRGKFRSLLFKIAESKTIDAFRRTRRMTSLDNANLFERKLEGTTVDPHSSKLWDQAWDEEILEKAVSEAKGRVKPKTFECFKKVFLEGAQVKDVAREMGISPNLVSQHKHKVMNLIIDTAKNIRNLLGD